jgi:cation transport regulator
VDKKMPYESIQQLPKQVKEYLPEDAQKIFKEAYNNAWEQYKNPEKRQNNASREETANKVAWSAVKKVYEKKGDKWVKK